MATIINPDIIKVLLDNKGVYPGDPPALAIYSYEHSDARGPHFAVFWRRSENDLAESPFVRSYTLLMEKGVLTTYGREWLATYGKGR